MVFLNVFYIQIKSTVVYKHQVPPSNKSEGPRADDDNATPLPRPLLLPRDPPPIIWTGGIRSTMTAVVVVATDATATCHIVRKLLGDQNAARDQMHEAY